MVTVIAVALAEEAEHIEVAEGEVLLVTGPGKVRSATALASCLATEMAAGRVELVVNLGTAGALVPGLAGLLEPTHLLEHDFDAEAIEALLGRPYPSCLAIEYSQGTDLTLATGDRFLTDPAVGRQLRDRGVHLVDMEAAALHLACRHHGVPFRSIKVVSDMADADALRSWKESVGDASVRLGAWLAERRPHLTTPGS